VGGRRPSRPQQPGRCWVERDRLPARAAAAPGCCSVITDPVTTGTKSSASCCSRDRTGEIMRTRRERVAPASDSRPDRRARAAVRTRGRPRRRARRQPRRWRRRIHAVTGGRSGTVELRPLRRARHHRRHRTTPLRPAEETLAWPEATVPDRAPCWAPSDPPQSVQPSIELPMRPDRRVRCKAERGG